MNESAGETPALPRRVERTPPNVAHPPFRRSMALKEPWLPSWLLSLYLGTALIYWLPGVSVALVSMIKMALLLAAVGATFLYALRRGVRLPAGLWGPIGFLALAALATPGVVQSDVTAVLRLGVDFAVGAVFAWCFFNLTRLQVDVGAILARAAIVVSLLALVPLANSVFGWPMWQAPLVFNHLWAMHPFNETGLAFRSSAWAAGLAHYFPFALFMVAMPATNLHRRSLLRQAAAAAGAVAILCSQLVSGGRGGVLASLCVLGAMCWLLRSRTVVVCMLGGAVALALVLPFTAWELVARRLPAGFPTMEDVNYLSTSRVEGALLAMDKILERPFQGHGIDAVLLEAPGGVWVIHNAWLKFACDFGVFMPLFLLAMVAVPVRRGIRIYAESAQDSETRRLVVPSILTVAVGLFISMLDPSLPFGGFGVAGMWWAAIGVILGTKRPPTPDTPGQRR